MLFEQIKGGLRLAAVDVEAARLGLKVGQNLADARAMVRNLTVREMDRQQIEAGFGDFADWHSNASPLVAVITDVHSFGDLMLDITGVSHLFGGEAAMLRNLLYRLRNLGYDVFGAIASTMGAAWAVSHFTRSQIVDDARLEAVLDALPIGGLRINADQHASLMQMGLKTIGAVRGRPRKPLQARFGLSFLTRIDQAYGFAEERMVPRLPVIEHYVEQRFVEPLILLDSVLAAAKDLALQIGLQLELDGLGAQTFHLFLYRVDHKVMTLSVNSARVMRDPAHIFRLFTHRAQRLEGEYDAGFGIDMLRLAISSIDRLDGAQTGIFADDDGTEDLGQLTDRMSSRLGSLAVSRTELFASHMPERAARLVPVLAAGDRQALERGLPPQVLRPLRLLPAPEQVAINAEVPNGLPASMIWRRENYRLVRGVGPERLGAEWWRSGQRLELAAPPDPDEKAEDKPYVPNLVPFEPDAVTRDYFMVEDGTGRRFWVFRHGAHRPDQPARWYLHGFFP